MDEVKVGFTVDEDGRLIATYLSKGESLHPRSQKGKSILELPSSYVVIDTETTGLDSKLDSIIEIAAVRYENGVETDSFSELIRPLSSYHISEMVTQLTGISNEMVSRARPENEVLGEFFNFIKPDDILVGHNINFDINFLYDSSMRLFGIPVTNSFVDTMRMARRIHNDWQHHRLKDLRQAYSISDEGSHRALSDARATQQAYCRLIENAISQYGSAEEFLSTFRKRGTRVGLTAAQIVANTDAIDDSHPLYGKTCVFTGALEKMIRREAMQLVVNLGGKCGDNVTKKTNYLILGDYSKVKSIEGKKSSKHRKAEENKLKGYDIEILSEDSFYDLVES